MSTLDMIEAFLRRHKHKASQDKRPFLKHLRLDGKTPQSERLKLVGRFKCPPEQGGAHCFLITTGAGGVGLNLPAASRVVLFDSSWNPATDAQAAVRAFRMGQTKPVFVYRLVSYGAMEGHVYDRSVSKAQLARQVCFPRGHAQSLKPSR
jgi:SNF2 family DNA or RNA helicase